jgi:hypothetical protein
LTHLIQQKIEFLYKEQAIYSFSMFELSVQYYIYETIYLIRVIHLKHLKQQTDIMARHCSEFQLG